MGAAGRSIGKRWFETTGPLPSTWPAQGVDDSTDQPITHWHIRHAPCSLDLISRVQMFAFAEEHDTDFIRIDVERDAVQIARKFHEFIEAHIRKTRDLGNSDGDTRDRSHLPRRQLRSKSIQRPADACERLIVDAMQAFGRSIQWSAFGTEGVGTGS